MQFLALLAFIPAVIPVVLAGEPSTLAWDPVYSNPSLSTLQTECSDGENGLYTKGYHTIGALPSYPRVATVPDILGWNSPFCGACYKVYYSPTGKSVYVTAIGAGYGAFVGSQQVLDTLTNGRAQELGRVNISWAPAARSLCGL